MAHVNQLSQPERFITTHNSSGQAIFLPQSILSETLPFKVLPDNQAAFGLAYTTSEFPVSLSNDKDIDSYKAHITDAPGLVTSKGTILRYVDCAPGSYSAMHRTVSLDFGIVLEGESELILDSGETRLLKKGDIAIQRGTKHAWRNPSKDSWTRLLFVLQPCEPVEIGGEKLDEDLHTMQGVRNSD